MVGPLNFYPEPRGFDTRELCAGIDSILLGRASGQTLRLDPAATLIEIRQEHPPVERMEGDLGAICEVFKESSNYFLTLGGVPLAPGDQITLTYRHKPYTVSLRVVELENGRGRIDPPVIVPATA